MSVRLVEPAAVAMSMGASPARFLRAGDPVELLALRMSVERAQELLAIRDHNLAVAIANNVGQLFRKG